MGIYKTSGKYIKFFIYLVIIVLVNVVGVTLFFRADLTRNNIYSISDVSREVVSSLSEPLTIKVFFTKNLPAPHNGTERYLRDLLEEYAVNANRYFNYSFYDVTPEDDGALKGTEENREQAEGYGIHPVQIQLVEKDEIKFKKAFMGLVLIHGDIVERIPTITTTEGLEYEITTAIQKMNNKISALLNLKEKVKVDLYLSSSLQTVAPLMGLKEMPQFPGKIEEVVTNLNKKNYDKLQFRYIDPTREHNLKEVSDKFNFSGLKWPAVPEKKIEAGEGIIGLVMEYGDKKVEIPLLNVLQIPIIGTQYDLVKPSRLENIIEANLESLIDINENMGYLADHGTLKRTSYPQQPGMQQQDELKIFNALVGKNYSMRDVNLKDGPLADGFNTLVIASPKEKFTDYELYQIDQFLMRGKNLAIFTDAYNEVMPSARNPYQRQPVYVPMDTGLEKLLAHYGVTIGKSYVLDKSCYKQRLPKEYGGGEKEIYYAPIIRQDSINKDLDIMKDIKGLITIRISPLELDEKRIADMGITAHRLISSSDESWEMKDNINLNPMMLKPPAADEKMESRPLAYILEGAFTSYFKGKPMPTMKKEEAAPEKKDDKADAKEDAPAPVIDATKIKGESAFLDKGTPAKIFVIASSELLKDSMLDEEGRSPNAMFVLNVIDYLNDRGSIAAMRSKEQGFNPLYETDSVVKTFVKTFNIAVLPIFVVLFGVIVLVRRISKKKRIQAMFQK